MPRAIVHLDADAFFASVEQAADSRLRGKAIAVGGEKRGIIASASYEARRFGVYTPMPTSRARKLCPKLIILPCDFEKYEHFSKWMFSYAQDFTPDVEIASIDEGYFDLSATGKPPVGIANTIRTAIRQSLKISVSEGIASNKLVSQIASKMDKPNAFRDVPFGTEIDFLHPLPNRWLPGVGPHTAQRLDAAGLAHIRHIAATPTDMLHLLVGNMAPSLKAYSNGIDERPVVTYSAPAKSFSQQQTFEKDITDEDYAEAILRRMADELMAKVRADGKSIRTLTVRVRYNDMAEDQCGDSLLEPTDLETDLYSRIHTLFRQAWRRRVSLRLVSLKLSNVYDGIFRTELALDPAAEHHDAQRRLAAAVDQLRNERGRQVVLRGHDFRLRDAPVEIAAEISDKTDRNMKHRGNPPHPSPLPQGGEGDGKALTPALSHPMGEGERFDALGFPSPSPPRGERVGVRGISSEGQGEGASVPRDCISSNRLKAVLHTGNSRDSLRRLLPIKEVVATYVPLNLRSYYSFLNSTLSIDAIIKLAQRHGMKAIALTDEGNLHGAVEFTQAARAAGIKPILGATVQIDASPTRLYVENATGYRNLCHLLSSSARRAESKDEDEAALSPARLHSLQLDGLTDGLIAVSPDTRFAHLFGGHFYFEVSTPELLQSRPAGLPSVAALPVHYAKPGDRWKFDVVQSIRTRTLLKQAHPGKTLTGDFHFRPVAEMAAMFRDAPEMLSHGAEIADRCAFELSLGAPQFPAFTPPDGSTSRAFLRKLVMEGLRHRYRDRASQFQPQIEEELTIIAEVGYEEYFLVVWDILQDCRQKGIEWITRGSAADSMVCYCLGISDVCPIRFDLYFKRFLNKERMKLNKLPDIDVDFPHDRKDDVIDLLFAKHGTAHTAVVGGFSTFQARSAVAEVAKALGVSEFQIRRFTEHFPWSTATEITEALSQRMECRDLPIHEEPYRSALQMGAFLDGFPRYPKMHPCGVVLSRQPMSELTPTFISNKGYPTTHFDMDAAEAIGLVKMDILAQGGLAVMRDARETLTRRGVQVDLGQLEPWDDAEVWKMLAGGGSRAVHHIESPAMIGLCRQSNVHEVDGLVAIVSVIRPGAANEQKKLKFTRRYQGLEPVTYPHPSLEACLKGSYGLIIYEEHILQVCEAFAGLPPGRADVLRRALSKMKQPVIEEIGREFIASARARGHSDEKIAEVWDLVAGFAGYAFCKAHSTAYGVEAYQSAWLKHYYPVEFMAAVLSNGKGFYHPLVYILECHRLKIPLLPPSVNSPGPGFAVEGQSIRIPLTRAMGIGERTKARMVAERRQGEFTSLSDFYRRVMPSSEEMEPLIRVGGLDCFGQTRTAQFWEARHLCHAFGGNTTPGQGWLLPPAPTNRLPEIPLQEPTRRQQLEWETELLGFTASGHPLELHDDVAWDTYCPVSRLGDFVGEQIVTCGLVIEQRTHHQSTGEIMKFMTLADWTGIVETELFAQTYRNYGLATVRYPVLEITATVEPFENGHGFSLRVQMAGKPRTIQPQNGGKV